MASVCTACQGLQRDITSLNSMFVAFYSLLKCTISPLSAKLTSLQSINNPPEAGRRQMLLTVNAKINLDNERTTSSLQNLLRQRQAYKYNYCHVNVLVLARSLLPHEHMKIIVLVPCYKEYIVLQPWRCGR